MQKNLPKLLLLLLIALIGIILLLALFLKIKTQTDTTATEKVIINSSIYPYTAKSTPLLEKELDNLNFWTKNTLFSSTPPKKLTININYTQQDTANTASFRQLDKDGNILIAGKRSSDEYGEPIINIYIDQKVFSFPNQNPADWINTAFWKIFHLLTIGPASSDGSSDSFLKERGSGYFTIKK